MSLMNRIRVALGRETRAAGNDPSWNALTGGGFSASGAHVDGRTAESISAVFGCVQALSESTACLPLHVFRRNDDGSRERADDYWLSRVLERPNDWQTGMEFRESQTASILLWGNAYARIERNGSGEVTALHPMHPNRTSIVRLDNGRYRYDYADEGGKVSRLLPDEVLHLRDRTDPGSIVGKSRIAIARDTLGLSITLRQHGARYFGRGARPASVMTNENTQALTAEQRTEIKEQLDRFASPENAGKTMVLPPGFKYETVGMSNEDSEWLAAQQFGVTEVCRMYRVPPILVQTLEQASYNNVAALGDHFVKYSLVRWINLWEASISAQLLGPISRQRYYAEHNVDALLRGNAKERSEVYANALNNAPWMTTDEVRRLENMPPQSPVEITGN